MPKKHTRKGKPSGMTYMDMLTQKQMIKSAVEQAASDHTLEIRSNQAVELTVWMMLTAIGEVPGIGAKRTDQIIDQFLAVLDEYNRLASEVDPEYAKEKVRQRAEQVSGEHLTYAYDKMMKDARARNEQKGVFFGEGGTE